MIYFFVCSGKRLKAKFELCLNPQQLDGSVVIYLINIYILYM